MEALVTMKKMTNILQLIAFLLLITSCGYISVQPEIKEHFLEKSGFFYIKPDEIVDLQITEHVDRGDFDQCKISKIVDISKKTNSIMVEILQGEKKFLLGYSNHDGTSAEQYLKSAFRSSSKDIFESKDVEGMRGSFGKKSELCKFRLQIGNSVSDLLFVKGIPRRVVASSVSGAQEEWIYISNIVIINAKTMHVGVLNNRILSIDEN